MDFTAPTLLLVALCEFLVAVDPLLPGYWYLLKGNGLGSMSYLLGVSPGVLNKILFEAGILKLYGGTEKGELRFQKDIFYNGFTLLDGLERPKSVEHTRTKLIDSTKRKTRTAKKERKGRKNQHFIRIGSSTSARSWSLSNVLNVRRAGREGSHVTSRDATVWERGKLHHAMRRGGREGSYVTRCDGLGEREVTSSHAMQRGRREGMRVMRCDGVGERKVTSRHAMRQGGREGSHVKSRDATGWERGNARHAMRWGGREGSYVARCDPTSHVDTMDTT